MRKGVVVVSLVLAAFLAAPYASGQWSSKKKGAGGASEAKEKAIVMKVTDIEGKVTFEIGTGEDDVSSKKKELKEAFQAALKEYNALDADAKKNAQKPVNPSVKKVKTVDDLTVAAKMAMDLQKEYDEKEKKRDEGEDKKSEKKE